jgi:hypothetical protein
VEAGVDEAVVLDEPAADETLLAGSPGDGGGSGYDFSALASANRARSSPSSASTLAPSMGPRPGKLSRISLSACW